MGNLISSNLFLASHVTLYDVLDITSERLRGSCNHHDARPLESFYKPRMVDGLIYRHRLHDSSVHVPGISRRARFWDRDTQHIASVFDTQNRIVSLVSSLLALSYSKLMDALDHNESLLRSLRDWSLSIPFSPILKLDSIDARSIQRHSRVENADR